MILCVGGTKGGSGKTTTAVNLTILHSEGHDVLLVDADAQETASDFSLLRNETGRADYSCVKLTGAAVRTEILKLKRKYEDVLVDTGGRDTSSQRAALSVADFFLVPFLPRSFDLWTLEKSAAILEEMRLVNPGITACVFINRADPHGSETAEAAEMLREVPAFTLLQAQVGDRKAFAHAASAGLCVTELARKDMKAVEEIRSLYEAVYSPETHLQGST